MTIQPLNSHLIPLELVDIILNNLYEDSQWTTIASCTLVCHSWVDFARRYLFRNITIGGEGKGISGFLHLVKTTPTISSCIKDLVIKMTPNRPTVYGFYSLHSYSSPAALPPRIIVHILNKLSELRKLSLIGLILGSHEADDPPLPLEQFKLDALELRSVFTESMGVDGPQPIGQNIVDLLGTFREIKTLTLYDSFLRTNRMDDDTPDSLCIPRNRPIVQHLSLGFLRPCNFCQAQLALMALTTSQLTTLSVCCTEHSDVNAVTFHLNQFGSQLTHFEFDTRKLHYDALRGESILFYFEK
ncbi:hypothetical protein C8Q75DRAFT_375752 [Abortiporus biennis]|nr:hypothetical protein C8Q75DRAFT_375752 [Abortiporus biennis]